MYDHDKQAVREHPAPDELADGSFTDGAATHQGTVYAFNSYASFDKQNLRNYFSFNLDTFLP